jgi:hypothetical protein
VFTPAQGSWPLATKEQLLGTMVHELGHMLGLGHGGQDTVNYKPNHLSVMNYAYQLHGVLDSAAGGRVFGYSDVTCNDLDEHALNEEIGVRCKRGSSGGGTDTGTEEPLQLTAEFPVTAALPDSPVNEAIDWDGNGEIDSAPLAVSLDLNNDQLFSTLKGSKNEYKLLQFKNSLVPMDKKQLKRWETSLVCETADAEEDGDGEEDPESTRADSTTPAHTLTHRDTLSSSEPQVCVCGIP